MVAGWGWGKAEGRSASGFSGCKDEPDGPHPPAPSPHGGEGGLSALTPALSPWERGWIAAFAGMTSFAKVSWHGDDGHLGATCCAPTQKPTLVSRDSWGCGAAGRGLEPRLRDSKSRVLPLDDPAVGDRSRPARREQPPATGGLRNRGRRSAPGHCATKEACAGTRKLPLFSLASPAGTVHTRRRLPCPDRHCPLHCESVPAPGPAQRPCKKA